MSAVDSPVGGHTGHPGGGVDNLVRMLNRIGDFYASYPDHEEAIDGIATHVRKFWEPRMRRQIYAHLDATGAEHGLQPLVEESLRLRRGELAPAIGP